MRALVVGLGSMGKRRIRCLQALGERDIFGFDIRADRRDESSARYGIKTFSEFTEALDKSSPNVMIVSVPPDKHHVYAKICVEMMIPCFVEASVVDTEVEWIQKESSRRGVLIAPSATLMFHPAIQKIRDLVGAGKLGKISNVIFHSGQYLPDWHTYEKVSDFYVSNPETGGCREIVPFELTWITRIFGFPNRLAANFRKTIDIAGAERIDDTYNILLDYGGFLATVTVDVVSRHATRRLLINGDNGQLIWDWDDGCVRFFDGKTKEWKRIGYETGVVEAGYNSNIGENMYVDEIRNFLAAVSGQSRYVSSLEHDHRVLKLLYAAERSEREGRFVDTVGSGK